MPISKVVLDNQSKENVDLDGQFVRVPHGTTAQRPSSPAAGQLRFNTDLGTLEQYNTNTNAWAAIDSPPIISTLAYSGSNTATDPAGGETITLTGSNFKDGFTVTVGGTTAASTTFVDSTTVRFTTPVKTAGDYDVVFTNSNGLAATLTAGISFNGTPAFTTAAGSVGSIEGGLPISTITIVASEPDGGTLAYSITQNALPAGLSLGSANGQITGTPTAPTTTTTSNFTITATDDENQTNSRAFSLQVLRPINAYNIPHSLEFNGSSHYLEKNGWPTATDSTRATFSAWVKKTDRADETTMAYIFGTNTGAASFNRIGFSTLSYLDIRTRNSSGTDTLELTSNKVFEDTNGWYHLVVAYNWNASGAAKATAYINGVVYDNWQSGVLATSGTGFSHYDWFSGSSAKMRIGRHNTNSSNTYYSKMTIAEVQLVDGQTLNATDFGEFNNGVWVLKEYTGTYGNSGFHLDFADNSNLGNDVSGNNNDFTTHNLNTNHQLEDTPTNSFPHLDMMPSETGRTNITGRSRIWAVGDTTTKMVNTTLPTTGKWYWEWRIQSDNYAHYISNNTTVRSAITGTSTVYAMYPGIGTTNVNCTEVSYDSTSIDASADGDVFANRWNGDTGTMEIYRNNTKVAEFNAFTIPGPYYIAFDRKSSSGTSVSHVINFGQDGTFNGRESPAGTNSDANGFGAFKYAVPSGHLSMCSRNLPDPLSVIEDVRPEDFFQNHLYTGNSSTNAQTIGFRPDFVWIKRRDANNNHRLYDSLNYEGPHTPGAAGGRYLLSAGDGPLATATTNNLTSFDANGFTVHGTGGDTNLNTEPYIAWCWKAGGEPTATNSAGAGNAPTSGSVMIDGVASTAALAGTTAATKLSANTKSGFSIIRYTGTGSDATIAHGLTKKPVMIIVKNLTDQAHWTVFHEDVVTRNNDDMRLNTTGIYLSNTNTGHRWNVSTMSNSVIGVQGSGAYSSLTNQSGKNYVAYCWHDVDGYCSIGKYEGTNSASNGAYVNCGFKPAFVVVKSYTNGASGYDWVVFDNNRNGITQTTDAGQIGWNNIDGTLNWNGATDESATHMIQLLSTGFKHESSAAGTNSSQSYIYMAFAENPQKYARGR